MTSSHSDSPPADDPTIPDDGLAAGEKMFSDVEGERLFEQVRSRLFARPQALKVGRYRILRRIGAGAMGEVQLAIDDDLDRPIAIKFVHVHLAAFGWAERLRTEARALARLAHPNVVHVYEVGEHQGHLYLAMEYIEGGNLRDWIREAGPSWEQVLAAYLAAGRGLAAAHGAGVIHRDFKPENVLRGNDGRVAVADFGLAALERGGAPSHEDLEGTLSDRLSTRSSTDEIKGTPAYMPPEQFRGRSDARVDQFALCVSIYEGLWGQRPFSRTSIDHDPDDWIARPPPRRGPVPGWLWPILRRGLAPDPDDRWPSLDQLLAAIERGLLARRRQARWLGSGLAALGVGVLSGVAVGWWHEPEPVDACAMLDRELDGTWDGRRREQLTAIFAKTGETSRTAWLAGSASPVITGLDRWRERWLDRRTELCRARAGGDRVILDRLGACLERQRRSAEATIDLLLTGDADRLAEAPLAVQRLADPRSCDREARLGGPPDPPRAIVDRVERLRARLAVVEAELALGDHRAALAEADAIAAELDDLDYVPLHAEIAQLRGRSLLVGDPEQALEVLEQAADLAEGAHHDRIVAESWRWMAMVAATERHDLERGRRWLRRADAATTRLGVDPSAEARLDYIRGHLRLLAGDLDGAIVVFEPLRAAFEDHGDLLYASFTQSALGRAQLERGEGQRAVESFERALAQLEQVYGPQHRDVALAAYNLGQALLAHDPALAPALLERAVAIWTGAESPPARDLGRAHFALAQIELDAARFEPALEHARAAADLLAAALPADDIAHAEVAMLLATSYYFLGLAEPALAAYRAAVAGYSAAFGVEDVYTANFRVGLGWALLATGQRAEARAEFQAGLATIEAELGVGTEDSVDARLGLVAVALADGELELAGERLASFAAPPLDDINLLVFELFGGLLAVRGELDDRDGAELLGGIRERARAIDGGQAVVAIMLDSVDADQRERALAAD